MLRECLGSSVELPGSGVLPKLVIGICGYLKAESEALLTSKRSGQVTEQTSVRIQIYYLK